MAKVFYIGDWAVQIGPVYAETSFNHAAKGLDFINYGKWLVQAVESSGRHEIRHGPCARLHVRPGPTLGVQLRVLERLCQAVVQCL